jgi:hypothetical protein
MIKKNELKGKYVEYIDRDGMFRIAKVAKISGSWLSLKRIDWKKHERVHKDKVLGRMRPKLGKEEIEW